MVRINAFTGDEHATLMEEPIFKKKKSSKESFATKKTKTLVLCYAYIMLGFLISIFGPSMLLLAQHTKTNTRSIAYLLSLRGVGYMISTLLTGIILDKFSIGSPVAIKMPKNAILKFITSRLTLILMFLSIILMGSTLIAMPFTTNYNVHLVLQIVSGVSGGCIDCVASVLMMWIWDEDANNYMQGLHASYGVGSFLAPLYLQIVQNGYADFTFTSTPWYVSILSITYVPIGILMLSSLLLFILVPFVDRKPKVKRSAMDSPVLTELPWYRDVKQMIVTLLTGVSLFLYCGVEGGFSSFITLYAQTHDRIHFVKSASLLASAFWLSFTVGRLVALPVSFYLSIRTVLFIDVIMCSASLLIMSLWKNHIMLWIATIVLGFFMAPQYPTTFSTPRSFLNINLSALMTSSLVVLANLGSTLFSLFLEQQLLNLFWILFGTISAKFISDAILLYAIKRRE
ncbi:12 TM domain-containing transmembrane protein [Acrasis kona]|uniref:12 TM domain-containing transmembrane protein n=1 Tax=Acrasis kona TaxID=1008807 RepID=A0AAW2YHX8_9EUKA